MPASPTTTHDLGAGWFANWTHATPGVGTSVYAVNEVLTIRNPDKGVRIDLPAASIDRLRAIFAKADTQRAA